MLLLLTACVLLAAVVVLAVLLSAQPVIPAQLSAWPSQGFLYLQLLRAAVKGKKPPSSDLKGKPIKVCADRPTTFLRVLVVIQGLSQGGGGAVCKLTAPSATLA
jgi:hypothetical protein